MLSNSNARTTYTDKTKSYSVCMLLYSAQDCLRCVRSKNNEKNDENITQNVGMTLLPTLSLLLVLMMLLLMCDFCDCGQCRCNVERVLLLLATMNGGRRKRQTTPDIDVYKVHHSWIDQSAESRFVRAALQLCRNKNVHRFTDARKTGSSQLVRAYQARADAKTTDSFIVFHFRFLSLMRRELHMCDWKWWTRKIECVCKLWMWMPEQCATDTLYVTVWLFELRTWHN